MKGTILVGTSGWSYKHWAGTFYPAGMRSSAQFNYYHSIFRTVEINSSFYRLPSQSVLERWRSAAPADFVFTVKASRFITHMKKLLDPQQSFNLFFERVVTLQEKLGPVLFQLPPRWKVNVERLRSFLGIIPKELRCAFEFREPSWYHGEVRSLLASHNHAFCIYELAGHRSPRWITADFVFVRLHGPGDKYAGSYDDATLRQWAADARQWARESVDVFIYFDNDQHGYAAHNAQRLQELCSAG